MYGVYAMVPVFVVAFKNGKTRHMKIADGCARAHRGIFRWVLLDVFGSYLSWCHDQSQNFYVQIKKNQSIYGDRVHIH